MGTAARSIKDEPTNRLRTIEIEDEPSPSWLAVSRGVSLFFGCYLLVNLIDEMSRQGSRLNIWWLDRSIRSLDQISAAASAARGLLGLAAVLFLAFALKPRMSSFRRMLTILSALGLFTLALWNAFSYYTLLKLDKIHADIPLPFSLHAAACLIVILSGQFATGEYVPRRGRDFLIAVFAFAACVAIFPLAQMLCFGKTDYRRKADVAVVFGAGELKSHVPPEAVAERVRTACRLYHDKLVDKLIVTGGKGAGGAHEADEMLQLAIDEKVPESAVLVDAKAVKTRNSVHNVAQMVKELGARRVLAVSHYYQLPRIKLCFRREGLDAETVPVSAAKSIEATDVLQHEGEALWRLQLDPTIDLIRRLSKR